VSLHACAIILQLRWNWRKHFDNNVHILVDLRYFLWIATKQFTEPHTFLLRIFKRNEYVAQTLWRFVSWKKHRSRTRNTFYNSYCRISDVVWPLEFFKNNTYHPCSVSNRNTKTTTRLYKTYFIRYSYYYTKLLMHFLRFWFKCSSRAKETHHHNTYI